MPGKHAVLSPSSSERWLECPASVRMAEKVGKEDGENRYAAEGTLAHTLGELKASLHFGKITKRQFNGRRKKWHKEAEEFGLTEDQFLEMETHTDAYVALIQEKVDERPGSQVFFEQRLDTGLPNCWGTSDVVILSPGLLEIMDLKYGQGIAVSATDNSQLRLYGLGALDRYGDLVYDTDEVRLTVFQPRIGDGHASSETLSADDLRAWRKQVQPIAMEALGPDAHFSPTETACRWCPAAGVCKARVEKATREDFGEILDADTPLQQQDPDMLSDEELAQVLHRLPFIQQWAAAVQEHALDLAYSQGHHLPGWKVVMSGGKRAITDADKAVERLVQAGFARDDVQRVQPQTLGHLEKLVKKQRDDTTLDDLLGPLLQKGEGRPSLVPEDDKRQAINPATEAAREFGPVE